MKTIKISAVRNGFDTYPEIRDLSIIFDTIKSDMFINQITHLRSLSDKLEIKKAKEQLPAIMFTGKFEGGKKDNNLTEHSGLCVLDFDDVVDLEAKKEEIIKHPFIVAVFVSPTGKGLKAVCKILPNKITHQYQYRALIKLFPELDTTSRSLSRLCYISHDPNIYVNYEAVTFEGFEEVQTNTTPIPTATALKTNYTLLTVAINKIRYAKDGQKHSELLKAARLVGGYIASGLVEEDEGIRVLEREILKKKITDPEQAKRTIKDGIEYGKLKPLSFQDEDNKRIDITEVIKSGKINQESDDFSFVADENAIWEYLSQVKNNTFPLGLAIDVPELDHHIRFKRNITVINGHDNVGKSTFLWYYFVVLAIKHDLKFIIFSAENSSGGVVRKLIEFKYCKEIKDLEDDQLKQGYDWVNKHFKILKNEDSYTYKDILARAAKLMNKDKYDGILIDPYNSLYRDQGKKTTHDYDYEVLGDIRLFTSHYNCAVYINCHPNTEASRRTHPQGHDFEYLLSPPNKGDTEGGNKFANRADDFWTIHRYIEDSSEHYITRIYVRKVREKETGGNPTFYDKPIKLTGLWGIGFATENKINPVITTAKEARDNNFITQTDTNFNEF